MNEELEGCQYERCCNSDKYFKLQKENTQLKEVILVDTKKEVALQEQITKLQQQLKDKDEKISKINEIITTMQNKFIDNDACFIDFDDYLWDLKNLINILESNKEN